MVLVGVAYRKFCQSLFELESVKHCRLTMRAINHDSELLALLDESLLSGLDVLLVVVRALSATAENNETVLVALGTCDSSQTLLSHAHEMVLSGSGANGVDRNAEVTIGTVLESDREGQTGGKLAVELAFGSTGTDGTDRDEVRKELRGDSIEHFGGDRHAGRSQVAEELTRDPKALVNLERAIDIRIVDKTLPADGGAGLLEVSSHHDNEVVFKLLRKSLESAAVLKSGGGVVK